jgi:hypothetical protein
MVHMFLAPCPQREHQFYEIIDKLLWPLNVTDGPSVSPSTCPECSFFEAK